MIVADPAPQPGAYYGLMSFFAKLTLALAAGLALPLLTAWGYFADRSGEVKRRFTVK